jgi:hypothetical protein
MIVDLCGRGDPVNRKEDRDRQKTGSQEQERRRTRIIKAGSGLTGPSGQEKARRLSAMAKSKQIPERT